MAVPAAITDLSTTAASNSPAGSEAILPNLDGYLRAHASFIAQLYAGNYIYASDHGVLGDDATDDTAALEAAVAAAVGKTLIINPGFICRITTQFDIAAAGIRVIGYGATIKEGASFVGTTLVRLNGTDITVEGLTIIGMGTDKNGISLTTNTCDGAKFVNLDVSGCGYPIIGSNNSNVLIQGNYVHDNTKYGIWCQNTAATQAYENIRVLDNRVDASHLDPATSLILAILVRGDASYPHKNVKVSGNQTFLPVDPTSSVPMGCEMRYIDGGEFSGNYSRNGSMLMSVALSSNITVDGNVSDGATFYGIEVAGSGGVGCFDVVVSNNTIRGRDRLGYGIGLQGVVESSRCVVTGNNISGVEDYGVFANSYWSDVVISNNTIYMATAASRYGVYMLASVDAVTNVVISGNTINGTSTALKGIFLYDVSYASISNNIINGWTENGIYLQSELGTVDYMSMAGNIFWNNTNNVNTGGAGAFGNNIQVSGSPNFRASGATGANAVDLTNDVYNAWGTNTPEGSVTAGVGSTFQRRNGGASTTLYVKESGTGNTGWRAV
jgi:parallel beta-helix repeat protein